MELNIPSKVRGIYNQDLVHNTLDCIVSKELGQAEFWLANTINDDFNCEALFLRLNGKVICLTPETSWVSSENNEYIEIPVGMNIYDRIHSFYMLTTEMDNDKISKIYGENWIVLQNRLLNAISDLNQDERRFVIFLSPLVRKAVDINPHQRNFTVVAKDFAKEYDIAEKHVYEKLKKISKSIHGKVFYYWNFKANKKANLKGVSWIGTAEYKDQEGMVEVSLLDEVIQMLTVFDKSNPFTKYERNHIANLGSHGIILFELISSCMHQLFKSKSYEIEFLREKFNCKDTYLPIAEFKRNVIDKAIKDVESNTPLRINYEQKKTGKRVTELLFSFYDSNVKKEQLEENMSVKNDAITTTEDKKVFGWQTKGLSDAQIKKIAVYQKEFIDANTSKMSPNDRRDYPEIFEDWKAKLKDPKQVSTFHKVQELLDRKKN